MVNGGMRLVKDEGKWLAMDEESGLVMVGGRWSMMKLTINGNVEKLIGDG